MASKIDPYRVNRDVTQLKRISVMMSEEEIARIDAWGVPAEMTSRSVAIRELVKAGLDHGGPNRTVFRKHPAEPQPTDQFVLRLPDGMRSRLKEMASDRRMSMNSLIVSILEKSIIDPLGETPRVVAAE